MNGLDYLSRINRLHLEARPGETELESRIENFELAARMQLEAMDVLDIDSESPETKKLYGVDDPIRGSYGRRCLLARRLVESGVRFVQVMTKPGQPWDHHNKLKRTACPVICNAETDQGVRGAGAGILPSEGMLDETIVMWAGEFGRLPTTQNRWRSRS